MVDFILLFHVIKLYNPFREMVLKKMRCLEVSLGSDRGLIIRVFSFQM
jgi:hypothetical protein